MSLWNGVQAVFKGTACVKDAEELRDLVVKNANDFIHRSTEAVDIIGHIGARRIKDGDRVLTHCNSKAALRRHRGAHGREGIRSTPPSPGRGARGC